MTNIREIREQIATQNPFAQVTRPSENGTSRSVWGEYDNFKQGFGRQVGDYFQRTNTTSESSSKPVKTKSDKELARETIWEYMKKSNGDYQAVYNKVRYLYPNININDLKNIALAAYIANVSAVECLNEKNYDEAIFCYSEAIGYDPENEELYLLRGDTKSLAGDYMGAIEDYTKVTEMNPENQDAPLKITETKKKLEESIAQIKNDYYTGDAFTVNRSGNIISITNQRTNEETILNLDDLCKDLSDEMREKVFEQFASLPAEVLVDIAKEVILKNETITDRSAAALYNSGDDTIILDINSFYNQVLPHETGHALDYNSGGKASTSEDRNFMENFESELEAYKAAGNIQYTEPESEETNSGPKSSGKNYATKNEKEMFAECYTLLMTGNCNSRDCIITYFPKTLEAAKNLLKRIRSLSDSQRHSGPLTNDKYRLIKKELWGILDTNGINNFYDKAKELLTLYPPRNHEKIRDIAMSVTYAYFAYECLSDKLYNEAIKYFDKAIEYDPEDAELYASRGDAKFDTGDYNGAVEDYKKVVELKPQDTYGNFKLEEARKMAASAA